MYLVIDESGHLHKRNTGRYFVIGGYLTENVIKINRNYKKAAKSLKIQKGMDIREELKSSEITPDDKRFIFKKINQLDTVKYVFVVIDKKHITRTQTLKMNLFYNYGVMILIKCLANRGLIPKDLNNLFIDADNKSIKVGSLNGLADYINTKVLVEDEISGNFTTHCQYQESHNHSGIQVADLLCNTAWTKFNYPLTDKVSLALEGKSYFCYIPYSAFGQ